jgi:hypothetical protein
MVRYTNWENCYKGREGEEFWRAIEKEKCQIITAKLVIDQQGEMLPYTPIDCEDRQEQADVNDNWKKWDKTEHFRKLWALKKGYKFSARSYDSSIKYK